ncbi:MAG: SUMF1/EgtB/PvdO family nonheme iron enzyme, partial [Spirochaetia bacterium]|nr:SUMF1/EgtB/PvdO family nonheme iron enzyme [Spirochaetia bacterium]
DSGGIQTSECEANCKSPQCGDGIWNNGAGEQCDGGGTDKLTCDSDCTTPSCGDGHTNTAFGEDCDTFGVQTDSCKADCTFLTDSEAVNYDWDMLTFTDFTFTSPDTESSVTQNFTVPTLGDSATTITWSSNDGSIVFTDGSAAVTQPTVGGNVPVTITATISKGSETPVDKIFTVTVIHNDTTAPNEVTFQPSDFGDGTITLNWTDPGDSDLDHLEITYTPDGATPVTVAKGAQAKTFSGLTHNQSYTFTVKTVDVAGNSSTGTDIIETAVTNDGTAIDNDKASLVFVDFTFGAGDSETSVTQDFTVPTNGSNGTIISWSSDDSSITIAAGGTATVTQPTVGGNIDVILTATIEKNGTTDTKEFTVTVITTDVTPPADVTAVSANAADGQVTLSWLDPVDIDFDYVEITWSGGGTTVAAGTQTYTATGLTNGTLYAFMMTTVDTAGNVSGGITSDAQPHSTGTAANKRIHSLNGIRLAEAYVPPKSFPTGTDDLGVTATVSTGYLMAETEVTYELWYAVYTWANSNGYSFANTGIPGNDGTAGTETTSQEPVTSINWRNAMVFSNALTEYYNAQNGTSLACVYTTDAAYTTCIRTSTNNTSITYGTLGSEDDPFVNPNAKGFRLPTNDEWELAARYIDDTNSNGTLDAGEYYPGAYASGATADYNNFDATSLVAWFGNSTTYGTGNTTTTQPVATKAANALGLYDMSGNVCEWAFDWHPSYIGTYRVYRGGYWFGGTAYYLRVGYVSYTRPYFDGIIYEGFGFRFARTP